MSKITKSERISTLEDAVAMNWSDMKKIETKISRAMTDMATRISNISLQLEGQQRQIHLAADSIGLNKQAIIMLENEREAEAEAEPQLKQLDQSVFDGLDEKWRFAAVDEDGAVAVYLARPICNHLQWYVEDKSLGLSYKYFSNKKGYDASNWQNSLIERDTVKELLEVDLSSELTGSDLCRAMLARGDKWVVCRLADTSDEDALNNGRSILVTKFDGDFYHKEADQYWRCAVPINNQGEPLTASEAGL